MKELSLNINFWHSILWRSTWGRSLPDNICGYFWSLVGAILLAPLAFVGHILNAFNFGIQAAWWAMYPVVCLGLGFLIEYDDKTNDWLMGFIMSILVAIAFATLMFCCIGLEKLHENIKTKKQRILITSEGKKPNPLVEGFKAFKGKYCSKINWKDEPTT